MKKRTNRIDEICDEELCLCAEEKIQHDGVKPYLQHSYSEAERRLHELQQSVIEQEMQVDESMRINAALIEEKLRFENTTRRKSNEQKQEENNEPFRHLMLQHQSILNLVPIGIVTTVNRKVQFANTKFYEMTG